MHRADFTLDEHSGGSSVVFSIHPSLTIAQKAMGVTLAFGMQGVTLAFGMQQPCPTELPRGLYMSIYREPTVHSPLCSVPAGD